MPLWVQVALPLVVVCVALLVGSNAFKSSPPTVAQRAAALESLVRCPSCIDVSVADSDESTAIAVRHEIVGQFHQGRSASQIEQTLVSQYGPTILLEPPDSGGFALIWIIPIVLGVGALGGVGVLFWRRTRQFSELRQATAGEAP
jgi:cytochrome c-type biogenesis protein CcmH